MAVLGLRSSDREGGVGHRSRHRRGAEESGPSFRLRIHAVALVSRKVRVPTPTKRLDVPARLRWLSQGRTLLRRGTALTRRDRHSPDRSRGQVVAHASLRPAQPGEPVRCGFPDQVPPMIFSMTLERRLWIGALHGSTMGTNCSCSTRLRDPRSKARALRAHVLVFLGPLAFVRLVRSLVLARRRVSATV